MFPLFRIGLLFILLITCQLYAISVGFALDNFIAVPVQPLTLYEQSCESSNFSTFGHLTISKEEQATDTWCGIATARIAMDYVFYRGTVLDQCALVSPVASKEASSQPASAGVPLQLDCCDRTQPPDVPDFYNSHCQSARWPEEIFNSRGFSYSAPYPGPLHLPLTWSEVINEICDEDRPYISTIEPEGASKHAVLVHGFYGGRAKPPFLWRQVLIYDPYDDWSYWDWERFNVPIGLRSYAHHGDTYKIRKLRSPYQPPGRPPVLPLRPDESSELPSGLPFATSGDPRDPSPKRSFSP